jgi:hypothetical protein
VVAGLGHKVLSPRACQLCIKGGVWAICPCAFLLVSSSCVHKVLVVWRKQRDGGFCSMLPQGLSGPRLMLELGTQRVFGKCLLECSVQLVEQADGRGRVEQKLAQGPLSQIPS